jgi:hypothetical protein
MSQAALILALQIGFIVAVLSAALTLARYMRAQPTKMVADEPQQLSEIRALFSEMPHVFWRDIIHPDPKTEARLKYQAQLRRHGE